MPRALLALIALLIAPGVVAAQSDFDKYPIRPMAQLIVDHDVPAHKNTDYIVSADPFPSKTAVIYSGERRPIPKEKKAFILLWFQTRNLEKNAEMLVNEYRFTEGEKDYWLPVVTPLEPFVEKELKKGDAVVLYYFFLGGYSKTSRDWVFAVEEFRKVS